MKSWNTFQLSLLLTSSLAATAMLSPWSSEATTRTVSNLNDSGLNSLRDTIAASASGDMIIFSVSGTLTLTSGELVIGRNLNMIGPASGLTVSGNNSSRVFNVNASEVNISGLTISDGRVAGANGTNVNAPGQPGRLGYGGAIVNNGTLSVANCTIKNNSAIGGNGGFGYGGNGGAGGDALGGAIFNDGILTLANCTFSTNSASGGMGGGSMVLGGPGGATYGGGIYNSGTLMLENCTFNGNSASGGHGGNADGGGLYQANGTIAINTIVAGNNAAGGIHGGDGNPTHNGGDGTATGPDISGTVTSQGHNLISKTDGSGGWIGSDLTGTIVTPLNSLLGPLQNNGGPTFIMALLPGSAAIDAGDDTVTNAPFNLTTDQRGRPRMSGAHVDIGAYELNPPPVVTNTNDSGAGSLRDAILLAAPGDNVTFASNVVGTIALTNGELAIGKTLTINGPTTAGVTVSGNNASRVLHLTGGATTISRLTIANGNASGPGAGIFSETGSTLVLSNCTISDNVSGNAGGGIGNNGSVSAYNCTFSGNQSPNGGGIYNFGGPVTLRNCTVVSNIVTGGTGAGGGIFNYSPYPGTSNNISSTIVAGNSAATHADVIGVFSSSGYNLIGKIDYSTPSSGGANGVTTSGLTNNINHDLVGSLASPTNALLGPLQDNGGPAFTHALLPGSPAIDKGMGNGLFTDQRGAPRPFDFPSVANASGGDGSDIGAFEAGSPRLEIQRAAGKNVVVSWPLYYGEFTLESVMNLSTSNSWSVAGAPVIIGNLYSVTNSAVGESKYFRLHYP